VGDRAVVKRFVCTVPGNDRPMVLPADLVAAGFDEMPAPLGGAGWQHADRVTPLVSISTFLPGTRDGWDRYVELLERSFEDRSLDAVGPAAALGAINARLHRALATPTDVLLLRALRVAQELHEFVYAVRYLPSWRYVPDGALAALLDGAS
jgi:predicted trehalose synthase